MPTKAIWGDTIRLEEWEVYFNPFWNMACPYQEGEAKLRRVARQLELGALAPFCGSSGNLPVPTPRFLERGKQILEAHRSVHSQTL